jgi:hypothetical protein
METQTHSTDGETPEVVNRIKETVKHPDEDQSDPEHFRIDQSEVDQPATKAVLRSIPIRKPDRLEFFRIHPDPKYRMGPVPFIHLKQSREFYIVEPNLRAHLLQREYWIGHIFLAVNRLGKPFFWLVTTQSPTGRISDWYTTALDCIDEGMHTWVQLIADPDAGGYAVALAEDDLGEPEWPEQSFQELFKLAFKRRTVRNLDHAVFKQLRGKV